MTETEQAPEQVETTHVDAPAQEAPESSEQTGVSEASTDETSTEAVEETSEEPKETEESSEEAEAPSWDGFALSAPEGSDQPIIDTFQEAAKEHGLAPDAAQKMLDTVANRMVERQMENLNQIQNDWIEASKKDPEIGGEKFEENLAVAKRFYEEFGSPELQTLLKSVDDGGQGLGNLVEIIRLGVKAGAAMQSDTKVVTGRAPQGEVDRAAKLYDKSNMT